MAFDTIFVKTLLLVHVPGSVVWSVFTRRNMGVNQTTYVYTRGDFSGFLTNPGRLSTGLVLRFTHNRTNPKWKLPGLVMSPEILNPKFRVGTLNPKTFESEEFPLESSLDSGHFSAYDYMRLQ